MASRRRSQARRTQLPAEPLTANEKLLDALLRHQIGLLRMADGTGRRVLELLDDTERDLRLAIRRRLRTGQRLETPADVRRLQTLLDEVRDLRGAAFTAIGALLSEEMRELAVTEPTTLRGLVETVSPVRLDSKVPPVRVLRQIVTNRPFEGAVLSEHLDQLRRRDFERISSQIRIGVVQGESPPQIARRVVGTVKFRGRNGTTEITRRAAEAIVRTATNAIANQARREWAKENDDIVDQELFVATLDAHTTPVCRDEDGNLYPIGEGPIPPLHFRCRSLRTLLLDPEPLGNRPMKPVTERMLLREFSEGQDFEAPTRRAGLPRGFKGPFDEFARRRVRELIGRVPAKVNYEVWLRRQSAAFQDDVLGKTKGRLFRRGGLSLSGFVNESGRELRLDEIAANDRRAFVAAGLDPEEFL